MYTHIEDIDYFDLHPLLKERKPKKYKICLNF